MQRRAKESAKKCLRQDEMMAVKMMRIMEYDGDDDAGDVQKAG